MPTLHGSDRLRMWIYTNAYFGVRSDVAVVARAGLLLLAAGGGRVAFEARSEGSGIDGSMGGDSPADVPTFGSAIGEIAGGRSSIEHIVDVPGGDLVIGGRFTASFMLGEVPISLVGGQDLFVARLDAAGRVRWARGFGSPVTDRIDAVALGPDGTIYVGGVMEGPIDFGGGPLANQNDDGFVVALTPSGDHVWSRAIGGSLATGPYGNDGVDAVVATSDGIVVGGTVDGSVDFGGMVIGPTGGSYDAYVAMYSSTGTLRWVRRYGVQGYNAVFAAAADSADNIYVSGFYEGSPNFGGGPVAASGIQDAFVLSLDAAGGYRWDETFGGSGFDWPYDIAVDAAGTVYVAGFFEQTITLGGTLTSAGGRDALLASYTATGALRWAKRAGSAGCELLDGLHMMDADTILATGRFSGTIDFGDGPLSVAGGATDGVVTQFDANGAAVHTFGHSSSGGDIVHDVAGTSTDKLYLGGFVNDQGTACDNHPSDLHNGFLRMYPP